MDERMDVLPQASCAVGAARGGLLCSSGKIAAELSQQIGGGRKHTVLDMEKRYKNDFDIGVYMLTVYISIVNFSSRPPHPRPQQVDFGS
jgi:hypothetical protein